MDNEMKRYLEKLYERYASIWKNGQNKNSKISPSFFCEQYRMIDKLIAMKEYERALDELQIALSFGLKLREDIIDEMKGN